MRLADVLAEEDRVGLSRSSADLDICGLAYDSRRVQPGFLFAAWAGGRADGHAFVPQAVQQGAVAVLCERPLPQVSVPTLVLPQVRRSLARAAQRFFGDPSAQLRMVGVTGTNGKTTTVHLVEAVCAAAGWAPGMIGTLGSRYAGTTVQGSLTTPESVDLLALLAQMQHAGTQAVGMEVSSQALAQSRVAGLRFDVGIFTNLTQDHLDYHKTLDAYFAAKTELVTQLLKPQGVAVLNGDDARVKTLARPGALLFSIDGPGDVVAEDVHLGPSGIRFTARTPGGSVPIHSPLLGRFNVENILAAVAAGVALRLPLATVAQGIAQLTHVPGRLERVNRPGEPLVLVDYAHTPDALRQALGAVREVTAGRLLCVFGCGGDRDPGKRAPMGQAAGQSADWSVLTNDNPRHEDPAAIAQAVEVGLQQAGRQPSSAAQTGYSVQLDRAQAIAQAVAAAGPQDAILIAGKGHESYQIIGNTPHAFDDRQAARRALDAVSKGLTHA